jgi:hypothetical protein
MEAPVVGTARRSVADWFSEEDTVYDNLGEPQGAEDA